MAAFLVSAISLTIIILLILRKFKISTPIYEKSFKPICTAMHCSCL